MLGSEKKLLGVLKGRNCFVLVFFSLLYKADSRTCSEVVAGVLYFLSFLYESGLSESFEFGILAGTEAELEWGACTPTACHLQKVILESKRESQCKMVLYLLYLPMDLDSRIVTL